jgi:hypothetical protein
MIRSVLAVLAGVVVLTLTSIEFAVNPLLMWGFPETLPNAEALSSNVWVRVLTYSYGMLCVAAGGYCAAIIAGRRPVTHAAALGLVQAGLTILAMFSPVESHASRLQWIIIAILSVPAALVGGLVYKGRKTDDGLEKAPASA